jgi:endonuclease/exonuclease/phosphatase family metal-dependent hydrolase
VTFGDSTASGLAISFISVHLDFSRRSVRQAQVQELDEALARLDHPFVLLGDFNSDWLQTNSAVRRLAERFMLRAHEPESDQFGTFVKSGRRLDWILISPGLAFDHYEVRPEVVSDHLAVVANISFTQPHKVALR